jgi:hypothetical protein
MASLVMESGQAWGDEVEAFQWADVRAVLASGGPRLHYWLRGRGMSKTGDAAALTLVLLLTEAPPRSRSYCYAVDERQASLLLDALIGFAERSGLLGLIEVGARVVTCKATGATLSVEASDSASAFGTKPWLTVVDEAAQWPDTRNHERLWGAIVSAQGKVPESRAIVMTSAGSPSHPSHKRWAVAEKSTHWRTSLQPGPCPWWSEADIAAAREQLLPAEFARYIECQWAEADESLATADDVAACVGHYRVMEPRQGVRYTMALDLGTKRDSTVLAVGHLEATREGRKVIIDRTLRWTGTRLRPVSLSDVETALLACWRSYGRPKLVYDPYQAAQLSERLKKAGVRAEEFLFSTSSVNRLARTLFGALRDRAILLPNDEDLLTELGKVRLVEVGPGLVRLDHRSGEHDDQAVTVAMVAATLLDRPTGIARVEVAEGRIPKIPLITRRDSQSASIQIPVVSERGERLIPVQYRHRVGRFVVDSRYYKPPGSWR